MFSLSIYRPFPRPTLANLDFLLGVDGLTFVRFLTKVSPAALPLLRLKELCGNNFCTARDFPKAGHFQHHKLPGPKLKELPLGIYVLLGQSVIHISIPSANH